MKKAFMTSATTPAISMPIIHVSKSSSLLMVAISSLSLDSTLSTSSLELGSHLLSPSLSSCQGRLR